MFNQTTIKTGNNSQYLQFNTPCTGILQRSNPKSFFIRFQKDSKVESMVFPSNGNTPYIERIVYKNNYTDTVKIDIMVLQILIFGDNYYLVEVIEPHNLIEKDFE